jgi:hypothetical protein
MALASVLRLRKELVRVVDSAVVPRDAVVRLEQPRLSLVTKYVALAIDDEAEATRTEPADASPATEDAAGVETSHVDEDARELPAVLPADVAENVAVAATAAAAAAAAAGAAEPAAASVAPEVRRRSRASSARANGASSEAAEPAAAKSRPQTSPTARAEAPAPKAQAAPAAPADEPVAPRAVVEPAPMPRPAPRREPDPAPVEQPPPAPPVADAPAQPSGSHYRELFSRHRVLFGAPIAICVLLSFMVVLGAPKSYVSSASLWFDTSATTASSTDQSNPALLPPSAQEQQILTELLSTRTFRIKVGREGGLESYLASHGDHGWSPLAVLSLVRKKPSLDYRVMSALDAKHVTTKVEGPQILAVDLAGPTPSIALRTLDALISEYRNERDTVRVARDESALAYYGDQMKAAQKVLTSARTKLSDYQDTHPGSSVQSDPQLRALTQGVRGATTALASLTTSYHQALVDISAPTNDSSSFRVIDQPALPTGAKSSKKKALMSIFAGFFVGGLLSFLGMVAYTKFGDPRDRFGRPRPPRATPTRDAEVVSIAQPTDAPARRTISRRPASARTEPTEPRVTRYAPRRTQRAAVAEPTEAPPAAEPNGDGDADAIAQRALAAGKAVCGRIVGVWDEGDGKQTRPVWTIRQPKRDGRGLAAGTRVWMVDDPRRQAVVRDVRPKGDGTVVCELEITQRKLAEKGAKGQLGIAPADKRWVGNEVTFVHGSPPTGAGRNGKRPSRPAG